MSRRAAIILIYAVVAAVSAAVIGAGVWLRRRLPEPEVAAIVDAGRGAAESWFELRRDLVAVNQRGEQVRLSDLRGKVWVVAEFFAICPKCAVRNGQDLRGIYDEFKANPDFHIVCITVDPETDTVPKLAEYAKALGAEAANWWFLTGRRDELHGYLGGEFKFLDIRERTNPAEIEQLGRYAHDLGLIVVDRSWRVIGKRDLAWAHEEGGPEIYQKARSELRDWIKAALAAKPAGAAAEP